MPTISTSEAAVSISSGESSYTVAKELESLGLVSSARDFDTYLCDNGYDKKLQTGTHTIPKDSSYEEIAKILMSRGKK
ncbi:MAG: endolytic transglycosylase MltG [Lachnospiraceae bacterium]